MKKILEIINLPGSAINFIGGQFRYLHEEGGYEMHLICSPGAGIEDFCLENGVKYYPVQLNRQLSIKQDIISLWKIFKYLKKEHIDIVIAHQSKSRLLGMLACKLAGVNKRVIFAHGILYETMNGIKRWLIMRNDHFVSSIATKVVCVSNYVKDCRLRDHIDKPEKQVILGRGSCNGLDTTNKFNPALVPQEDVYELKVKYGITPNDFVIGFCGRLVRDKGIMELIDAYKALLEKYPQKSIKLLIIGRPESRDGLPQIVLDYLTHSRSITCTGLIPFNDIQKYYLLMDVLVLPSHREGFGMVAVEAASMGRPIIVSSYTGCAETAINGITGFHVEKSSKSISDAIEKCFDKDCALLMGEKGREYVVNNFDHTIIRQKVLEMIKSLE